MAVVGNRKQLTSLLLLCIITSAVIPPWVEAEVTCTNLLVTLLPCADYALNGGTIPAACCGALKTVVDSLKTNDERQSACECVISVKREAVKATPEQLKRVKAIPDYCKVLLPFKIDKNVDCSEV